MRIVPIGAGTAGTASIALRMPQSENQARDRASDAALMDNGWHVLRVWEHEDLTTAASRIADQVRARALAR